MNDKDSRGPTRRPSAGGGEPERGGSTAEAPASPEPSTHPEGVGAPAPGTSEPTACETSEPTVDATEPSSARARVALLAFAVVVGLLVAAIPLVAALNTGDSGSTGSQASPGSAVATEADGSPAGSAPSSLTGAPAPADADPAQALRDVAAPQRVIACPALGAGQAQPDLSRAAEELRDVRLPCLTDPQPASPAGASQPLGAALVGRPSVVTSWAWWCAPCRKELPLFDELARRHPDWAVVGIHQDKAADAGVDFLNRVATRDLPSYQDASQQFVGRAGIPRVVPVTVVYRADGTRAAVLVKAFTDYRELEDAITQALA